MHYDANYIEVKMSKTRKTPKNDKGCVRPKRNELFKTIIKLNAIMYLKLVNVQ